MLSYLLDNNKIRDYKTEIVPQFGELKQSDVDLVLFYRDEYEKYFWFIKRWRWMFWVLKILLSVFC